MTATDVANRRIDSFYMDETRARIKRVVDAGKRLDRMTRLVALSSRALDHAKATPALKIQRWMHYQQRAFALARLANVERTAVVNMLIEAQS
jgi:hypothetical protein